MIGKRELTLARTPFLVTALLLAPAFSVPPAFGKSSENVKYVFPDPGITDPRMLFGNGNVLNNQPDYFPLPPDLPFPVSNWNMGQWHKAVYIKPTDLILNDTNIKDPRMGNPVFSFEAKDGLSRFSVFQHDRDFVYELYQKNGILRDGGGMNTFIAAKSISKPTMDNSVIFTGRAKLSKSNVEYFSDQSKKNGSVLAQAFWGFIFEYQEPRNKRQYTVFEQISIVQSKPGQFNYRYCSISKSGNVVFIDDQDGTDLPKLDFLKSGNQPASDFSLNLQKYLCNFIVEIHRCHGPNNKVEPVDLDAASFNLHNWILKSTYDGIETQNTDERSSSKNKTPQGNIEIGLQLSALKAWYQPDQNAASRYCPNDAERYN